MRRTAREWAVDIALILAAAAFSIVAQEEVLRGRDLSHAALLADRIVAVLAVAALIVRRRWPVHLSVVLSATGLVAHLVTGPVLIALFTVAARRPFRTTAWVSALVFAPLPVYLMRHQEVSEAAVGFFSMVGAVVGWGLFVRVRGQVARERAERIAADARRRVREDIAREMHDVLAHRLSLLSVHAGALEFNPAASPDDVRKAAGVIRESAHRALEDLREVLGVLRSPEGTLPQPVLADLTRLVEEVREAGTRVVLEQRVAGTAPDTAGRTVYRIVQEGLTNVRKHAPGAEAVVRVSGAPGKGLSVEVANTVSGAVDAEGRAIPGTGRGLAGLTERAALAGGTLEHGRVGDDFRIRAWLPWAE